MNTSVESQVAPVEPVLELADIQGAAIPGFLKPFQTLIGINCDDAVDPIKDFKRFIRALSAKLSTGAETLADRREYRSLKFADSAVQKRPEVLTGIAFSVGGLLKLTPGAAAIPSDAFQRGLTERSTMLGDSVDPSNVGNPANWVVGGMKGELDALILIAGDSSDQVEARVEELKSQIQSAHLRISYCEAGAVRTDKRGHEHFGFDDGVSQPGIRGRASSDPTDFITERYVQADQTPDTWLFGYPGQQLLWPGEFLIGYPSTSPDPLVPGHVTAAVPEWTRNASFLVFRRLRQDVSLFWQTMREQAAGLAKTEKFAGMTDERLASLLVGRWPSGAPVNRTPDKDIPQLGESLFANNLFLFDSDTLPMPHTGEPDPFPMAKADPAGITCPWAAHIRKVNTRDSASDTGSQDSTYKRRLLRVGIPFGKPIDPYTDPKDDPEHGNRGLLFLSVQSSIEDQFEFLCARWANDPARPKMPGGHDFIIGQNGAPNEHRVRRCTLFGSDFKTSELATDKQWVIPTGGGYFLLPSISAIRDVLGT
jgi:Dyp-type peroxidase family